MALDVTNLEVVLVSSSPNSGSPLRLVVTKSSIAPALKQLAHVIAFGVTNLEIVL